MEHKIVILGGGSVGKSALTVQFIANHFITDYDPTIEDCYRKQCVVDQQACLMDILDTAGQEEYSAMRDQYMRTGQGFVLVYDITSRHSFDEVVTFHDQVLRAKDADRVPLVLIGNKSDLESHRQVTTTEGRDLAKNFNCTFLETSAKARTNIEESFYALVRTIRREQEKTEKPKKVTKRFKNCKVL